VISISKDTLEDFKGYLTEIDALLNGKKSKQYYRQIEIKPRSGFKIFKNKIDSINLLNLSTV
jgi:soluble cytochrome b562